MNKFYHILIFFGLISLSHGCISIKYDLKGGATIDPKIKTVSVQYFDNRASRINPSLSQTFTDALKAYMESNTNLRVVNTIGDVDLSGQITAYDISSTAIAAGDVASKTRFTITIRVKYNNSIKPEESFDSSFSRYRDFDSKTNFNSVESELSKEIIDEILEQIFNQAFVNW